MPSGGGGRLLDGRRASRCGSPSPVRRPCAASCSSRPRESCRRPAARRSTSAVMGALRPARAHGALPRRLRAAAAPSPPAFRRLGRGAFTLAVAPVRPRLSRGRFLAQRHGCRRRALVEDDPRPDLDRVRCPTFLCGARATDSSRWPTGSSTRGACGRRSGPSRPRAICSSASCRQPRAAAIDQFLDGIGEVDELPLEAELLGELRRQRADA